MIKYGTFVLCKSLELPPSHHIVCSSGFVGDELNLFLFHKCTKCFTNKVLPAILSNQPTTPVGNKPLLLIVLPYLLQ